MVKNTKDKLFLQPNDRMPESFQVVSEEKTHQSIMHFITKFEKIEVSLDKKEDIFTVNHLVILLKSAIDALQEKNEMSEVTLHKDFPNDLPQEQLQIFLNWLKDKIEEYEASYYVSYMQRVIKWNISRYQLQLIIIDLQAIYERILNIQVQRKEEGLNFTLRNK